MKAERCRPFLIAYTAPSAQSHRCNRYHLGVAGAVPHCSYLRHTRHATSAIADRADTDGVSRSDHVKTREHSLVALSRRELDLLLASPHDDLASIQRCSRVHLDDDHISVASPHHLHKDLVINLVVNRLYISPCSGIFRLACAWPAKPAKRPVISLSPRTTTPTSS